jgi:hypothetical protein
MSGAEGQSEGHGAFPVHPVDPVREGSGGAA